MKVIQCFSKEQLAWLAAEGIVITDKKYTDDEIIDMIEQLEALLITKGIEHDKENAYGKMCGDILNIFGRYT